MCCDDALRLDKLVKDLLDLSRIESGESAPQVAAIPASALVIDAVEPLRRQADARRLTLRVNAPSDLPEVEADRGQVERVITNLVTNAIRATGRGGEIDIAATRWNGYIAISVRDTGRGILGTTSLGCPHPLRFPLPSRSRCCRLRSGRPTGSSCEAWLATSLRTRSRRQNIISS